jgi:excisionase family DNA binding protein
MDRLLTTQETADLLRIPKKTLYMWTRRGTGPKGKKLGLRVMYREKDVQAWLDEQFEGAS